jgi:hypothetical protein
MAIADRMEQFGIRTIYNAIAADIIVDGDRVKGAIIESDEDAIRVEASVTIDSTGDGDAAYLAGAEFTLG